MISITSVALAFDLPILNEIDQGEHRFESAGIILSAFLAILSALKGIHVRETQAGLVNADGVTVDDVGVAFPSLR